MTLIIRADKIFSLTLYLPSVTIISMTTFKEVYRVLPWGEKGALAKRLGVHPNVLWQWANGKCRPRLERMIALRNMCGIELESWKKEAAEKKNVVSGG